MKRGAGTAFDMAVSGALFGFIKRKPRDEST
jgi:hypothetical protein